MGDSKAREIICLKLKRFGAHLAEELVKEHPDFVEIKLRKKRAEDLYSEFDRIQTKIESKAADIDQELDEREKFDKEYFKILAAAESFLVQDPSARQQGINLSQVTNHSQNAQLKLPPITLTPFDGSYDKWNAFQDTFTSLIHNNTSLSQIEKFHYLKGSLTGDAQNVLINLETTTQNYQTAWNLIKERYENKKLIIQTHIKALFELQPVQKENFEELRSFLDSIQKHVRALTALGEPTSQWDSLLLYLFSSKLDNITQREWESEQSKSQLKLTFQKFCEFLQQKCHLLESLHRTPYQPSSKVQVTTQADKNKYRHKQNSFFSAQNTAHDKCLICGKAPHKLFACDKFMNMTPETRSTEIKKLKVCYNCLNTDHKYEDCTAGFCKKCTKKHNTLLHIDSHHSRNYNNKNFEQNRNNSHFTGTSCSGQNERQDMHAAVLLTTAVVEVVNQNGHNTTCRVLLDSGSELNFITKETCAVLGIKPHPADVSINGIGNTATKISEVAQVTIKSKISDYKKTLNFMVLPTISSNLPVVNLNLNNFHIPPNLKLADPEFYKSSKLNMLIGAEIYMDLLLNGQIKTKNQPTLQNTVFGWIISGKINTIIPQHCFSVHHCTQNLSDQVQKFWEIEEISAKPVMTLEESECEEHFQKTYKRSSDGRFIVRLPFKNNIDKLGNSYDTALKRFNSLEKRLLNNPKISIQYQDFMNEYQELSHMQETGQDKTSGYFLPHHSVVKGDSLTTKLRVVFDGSCSTSSGLSLNDTLMKGPTIQDDLFTILIRFRFHAYALTADIEKMYRQVQIHKDDIKYQKILWRNHPHEPIKTYSLTTVTYGTTTAPYLAIRSLQQLAYEHNSDFSEASKVVLQDFYVDDLITGASTISETIELHNQLNSLLNLGCFKLRKWKTNSPDIFKTENRDLENYLVPHDKLESSKTLGLIWNSIEDCFKFSISQQHNKQITKRTILGIIAQIFDPLGLVGPVILKAKLILKTLWLLQLDWDDTLPTSEYTTWTELEQQLPLLNKLKIPRNVTLILTHGSIREIQLHGFSDACEQSYGACVYVRATHEDGSHSSQLLCSKSRVAPVKTQSLPRLELCGAHLLSKLIKKLKMGLTLPIYEVHLWTDSTIVLHWLSAISSTWKVFISNRVAEIQQNTQGDKWHHVPTKENPADIISRGLMPHQLMENTLWWTGPYWLQQDKNSWPQFLPELVCNDEELERRKPKCLTVSVATSNIFDKYSSVRKLKRVLAYVQRFIHNIRQKENKLTGSLTAQELDRALNYLLKLSQQQDFSEELLALKANKKVKCTSKLLNLNPYLDEHEIIRVGGRLKHANIPETQKHPVVLSSNHKLTQLLIEEEHRCLLHGGSQAVLSSLRTKYWPLSGRNTVRKYLRKCITCFKHKPAIINPIMGDLPVHRVTPSRPFTIVGIDYAGPILIKESHRRGRVHTFQCYIAIFVCLSTKAVHLELVSGLTTEAFLAALKRFMSRRGKPTHIHSDNATNFVRANKELIEVTNMLASETHWNQVQNFTTNEHITWHYIPPRTPTFGGLWEAVVKSLKYHMKRITGNAVFTYEEYYTFLVQTEACLNSRPLIPLSEDPNDLAVLTPSHFLIGESLQTTPCPNYSETPVHKLTRWQHIQKLNQHFWSRWSTEYLATLQQRSKWCQQPSSEKIKVGSLVLLKEENLPPLQWRMGRISTLYPGPDGLVRVVEVKTANGTLKRGINKVCFLPID